MRILDFQKITTLLARQHRVTIEEGPSWAANIKTKTVFYRKKDIIDLEEDHILGLLLHEIGHIHYTTHSTMPKDNPELTGAIMNMLEDITVEKLIAKDYLNAGEILESTKQEVLDTLLRILPTLQISNHEKAILYASTKFEGRGYTMDIVEYEKVGTEIYKLMKKEEKLIFNRKKTKDFLPLSKQILDILIKHFKQPDPVDLMRLRVENAENYEFDPKRKGHNATKTKNQLIKNLPGKGGITYGNSKKEQPLERINLVNETVDQSKDVGKKLRTILKRNQAMEFGGRYRTGKLPVKRLIKIKTINDRRPFTRKVIKSNQSYAFAIATDVSGSMSGNTAKIRPIDSALSALLMTSTALKIANVKKAAILFGTDPVIIHPLSKAPITWEQIIQAENFNKACTGGTDIEAAMDKCTEVLKNSTEERKIMLLLTDGESCDTGIKNAYKRARKSNIECTGITIGPYATNLGLIMGEKNCVQIKNAKDSTAIAAAFVKILKETIKESNL